MVTRSQSRATTDKVDTNDTGSVVLVETPKSTPTSTTKRKAKDKKKQKKDKTPPTTSTTMTTPTRRKSPRKRLSMDSTPSDIGEKKNKKTPSSKQKSPKTAKEVDEVDDDDDDNHEDRNVSVEASSTKNLRVSPRKKPTTPRKHSASTRNKKNPDIDSDTPHDRKRRKDSTGNAVVVDNDSTTTSTTPTTMDVAVHRMRHLRYQPKSILCLESTPFHPDACDYVAVSRDNGAVELKSPDEKWRTVTKIAGMPSRTVDAMAWICNGRNNNDDEDLEGVTFASEFQKRHTMIHSRRTLLGASKDGTIFTIDFVGGNHGAVTGSGGGAVFCLVSLCGRKCCRRRDGSGQERDCPRLVAAGCEDGSVRIYRLEMNSNNDSQHHHLELVSTVAVASTAVLSLAWQCRGDGGTVLYAGVADGTIRRYDSVSPIANAKAKGTSIQSPGIVGASFNTQTYKSKYRMTVESYGRTTPTRVWALRVLGDDTVVSGDSLGHVQFWDGLSGTLIQTFDQNDQKADVLALAVSDDECQVFASGVDSRIVCIQRPTSKAASSSDAGGPAKWLMTNAQRPHTHDVRALAIYRMHSRVGAMVQSEDPTEAMCSGGVDTKLCSYMLKNFRKDRPKSWYPWPSLSPIAVAKEARVFIMIRDQSLELHKCGPVTTTTETESTPVLLPENETLIGTMDIQGTYNLVCCDISPDGKFFAISNASKTVLFSVEYVENDDGTMGFIPAQVKLQEDLREPSAAIKFLSNTRFVNCSSIGVVSVVNITVKEGNDQEYETQTSTLGLGARSDFPYQSLVASTDGEWIAVLRNGVGNGVVRILRATEGGSPLEMYWHVPAVESSITAVGFLEAKDGPRLVVACANFAFYVFDVRTRSLNSWSESLGFPMSASLTPEIKNQSNYPVRIAANPSDPNKFLMCSFGCFVAVNTEMGLPQHSRTIPETHVRRRKRRLSIGDARDPNYVNCTVCLRYNSMIHVDFLSKEEMLVVEQPWLSIVANFPGALERKIYRH